MRVARQREVPAEPAPSRRLLPSRVRRESVRDVHRGRAEAARRRRRSHGNILIAVSGDHALGGRFCVHSPVTGRLASAIVIDVGTADEYASIPPGCVYLHERLDEVGEPKRLERFQGGHGPIWPRAGQVMLPFFAEVLAAAEA